MVIIIPIILIILIGYLFVKINKKINILKETLTHTIKSQVTESKLYLLEETTRIENSLNSKTKENLNFLYKEVERVKKQKQNEFKVYVEDLINNKTKENKDLQILEFQKYSKETKIYIDELQQQLISNEFTKLRSDVNKDLNNIVKSVKNIKVF